MKSTFILGFLIGLVGMLLAAYFVPWNMNPRVVSATTVAINGGRQETFTIRLPADRIISTGGAASGMLANDPVASIAITPSLSDASIASEHFKVRNSRGEVIGVAIRHWTRNDEGAASTWTVSVPSRGSIVMSADGEAPEQLRVALERAGYRQGIAWEGEMTISLTPDPDASRVITGTEEFDGSTGAFSEVWSVSGVSGTGEVRGTIELNTIVNQTS